MYKRQGYSTFENDAEVRFQKTTQVVVRMVLEDVALAGAGAPRPAEVPWYSSTWGYVGIAAGAVVIGLVVGALLVPDEVRECDENAPCLP